MALAVAVVLSIRFVVLVVVGNEIAEREAVVRSNEIHARVRPPRRALIQVGAAGEAIRELRERLVRAAPKIAHGVAILAVPLRPQWWEVADLVSTFADVPRLGDQLDLAHDRILLDQVEERRQPIDIVQLARERRREVEPEP